MEQPTEKKMQRKAPCSRRLSGGISTSRKITPECHYSRTALCFECSRSAHQWRDDSGFGSKATMPNAVSECRNK